MLDTVSLIPNYIYFYHLKKFCVLPTYPDSITDSISSNFSQTQALSRSAPVFTYSNSGPRSVNFNLKLHRDMMNDMNKNTSNIRDNVVPFWKEDYIDTLIKYLQSIALPKYQIYDLGARGVIPPMIAVRFGNEVFIKGVVSSDIGVTYEKPILVGNKYAQASISFTVLEVDPYDAEEVVKNGSFRGITAAFKDGIYESTSKYSTAAPWQESELIFNNYQDNISSSITNPITSTSYTNVSNNKSISTSLTEPITSFSRTILDTINQIEEKVKENANISQKKDSYYSNDVVKKTYVRNKVGELILGRMADTGDTLYEKVNNRNLL